jgi:hypothetical protein
MIMLEMNPFIKLKSLGELVDLINVSEDLGLNIRSGCPLDISYIDHRCHI